MPSVEATLESVIAAHLAEWESPFVDQAIYGVAEPTAIADALRALCRRELAVEIAAPLFYQASIGAVAGLLLRDGRRIVVKAHQPEVSRARLEELGKLQRHLAAGGLYATQLLTGPVLLGSGLATIEAFDARGEPRDGHEPVVRRALANALHQLVTALEPFVEASALPPLLLESTAPGALWPTPHSKLFDFQATRTGAEDIDALATLARGRMTGVGRVVLGHGDWRVEHVRFEGDVVAVAYDWDSLCKGTEPALVGFTAKAFCADWSRSNYASAPTLDEARAFVADYEQARGVSFDPDERAACAAAFAYSVAYTSRCTHALGRDDRQTPGTFQHLLAHHGATLLNL